MQEVDIVHNTDTSIRLLTLYDELRRSEIVKNQKDFSEKFGISSSFFTEIKKGRSGVTPEALNNITEDFIKYREWLVTGRDSPFISGEFKMPGVITRKTYPLIPFEAIAGYGSDEKGIRYEDCEQYAVPDFEAMGIEFLIRVSGSSMYPKYSNGDVLACKKIPEVLFFQWGKVYVIDSSQGQLVKRVFEDIDNTDNIICASDNKENYPPFSMPKRDIRSVSLVLGAIKLD